VRRVIALPFGLWNEARAREVLEHIDLLTDEEVERELAQVRAGFGARHRDVREVLEEHYALAARSVGHDGDEDEHRRLLKGAYFTMEYSLEGAALFNPSMVPHPDQAEAPAGGMRVLMSLRATGEGHMSSVVFVAGTITADHELELDPLGKFSAKADVVPDRRYLKPLFARKLREMRVKGEYVGAMLDVLPERFALPALEAHVDALLVERAGETGLVEAVQAARWLTRSNYHLQLEEGAQVSDLIIFPNSSNEARGIEDMRLVRFVEEDGTATYFGTYTAFNGQHFMPMLMETQDFRRIEMHTLNGEGARNKGLALFPRRVGGHYCMCSRVDGRRLFISFSDHPHFWETTELLAEPVFPWELQLIGNCGSPIETPEGWVLFTHGVGPMRRYCIGALLLDLENPQRVIGRLAEPLLAPGDEEREGYVPNVLYSCGGLLHGGQLYLPYAMADEATGVARMPLDALVERLKAGW
jgi:predicted GH43/DUF377 family glycosyl hydrolase